MYRIVEVDGGQVKIAGSDGNIVSVGLEGRLHATLAMPQVVTGYDIFSLYNNSSVPGHGYNDETYVIPNGKTIIITEAIVGGEYGSSACYLYYCPNGTIDGNETEVMTWFFDGQTTRYELDKSYTGDGTAALVTRIRRFDKGQRFIGATIRGYVEQ